MASGGAATSTSIPVTSKTVSASLWWDSFVALSDDLDRATAAPSVPDALAKRIKSHHAWLRGSVSMFGKPNDASRSALDAGEVVVGEHRLSVKTELKEAALRASKCLFPHSGVFFLLITLAQELHSCNYKEASDIMDLLYRMVSSNKDLCFALLHVDQSPAVQTSKNLGEIENHIRIDIAKIFCNSIFKYVRDVSNADILSKTLGLLAEMIKCAPYHVFDAAFECNIFTSQLNGPSSDWLLSGALARMLFAASEGNGDCSSLTSSVLDFTIQVLRKGAAADDMISPLIVFSIQYIMVNHVNWKHKECSRWKTTLRVFELVKSCIQVKPFSSKLGGIIWEILLYDSSVYGVLWSILSVSTQLLHDSYRSNYHGLKDIEDIQLVLCNGLDIIYHILSNLPEDQVVCIVTEVVEAIGSSTLNPETEKVCQLLLVTLETSLYMELCVSQSCGIRPVLGRLEDFCKGIKAMLQAIEKNSSFKPFVRSLTEITTLLYPGLLHSNLLM